MILAILLAVLSADPVWEKVDLDKVILTEKQNRILKSRKDKSGLIKFEVVRLKLSEFKAANEYELNVFDKKFIVKNQKDSSSFLKYEEGEKYAYLSVKKNSLIGLMFFDKYYVTEPLGDGLIIVEEIDQTKWKDHK